VSLNYAEIDILLSELNAPGAFVQSVVQPTYETLALRLYQPGRPFTLFVCLAPRGCCIHLTSKDLRKPPRPLRFNEFLKARLVGARITEALQLGRDRIVRLTFARDQEILRLYLRLWSNAANAIVTDEAGYILDAMFRRPKRGEMKGSLYRPEEAAFSSSGREYEARDFPGSGSYSERVEAFYDAFAGTLSTAELAKRVESVYSSELGRIDSVIASIRGKQVQAESRDALRAAGDALLSSPPVDISSGWLEADDPRSPGQTLRIEVDPRLSLAANAERYYLRAKKAAASMKELELQLTEAFSERARIESERARLLSENDPLAIERFLRLERSRASGRQAQSSPGISIRRGEWLIMVGRSAAENDALLRRHVRGSDYWVHARDFPGSYVFIKVPRGKSPPLDILLDAANLAVYHSKARASGVGEVHYTMVKYLRRAKDGPRGLVIPTQEKNLSIRLDPERIRRMKIGDGDQAEAGS
jgi:predicted ribosome quality control (RQC) complex YloA/Tae2 family protein